MNHFSNLNEARDADSRKEPKKYTLRICYGTLPTMSCSFLTLISVYVRVHIDKLFSIIKVINQSEFYGSHQSHNPLPSTSVCTRTSDLQWSASATKQAHALVGCIAAEGGVATKHRLRVKAGSRQLHGRRRGTRKKPPPRPRTCRTVRARVTRRRRGRGGRRDRRSERRARCRRTRRGSRGRTAVARGSPLSPRTQIGRWRSLAGSSPPPLPPPQPLPRARRWRRPRRPRRPASAAP
jgi:hypothetical protein